MKLAASNIGWGAEDDQAVFEKLKAEGFFWPEIAPTRLVPAHPYEPDNRRSGCVDRRGNPQRMGIGYMLHAVGLVWTERADFRVGG